MSEVIDTPKQIRDMTERAIRSCIDEIKHSSKGQSTEQLPDLTKNILIYYDKKKRTEEAARQAIQPVIKQYLKQYPHFNIECNVYKNTIHVHVFQ